MTQLTKRTMTNRNLAPGEARALARLCLRAALIVSAVLAGFLAAPAFAQEVPSAPSALERGEHLVALPDDAPYMLEEIAAYLVSNPQARIGE